MPAPMTTPGTRNALFVVSSSAPAPLAKTHGPGCSSRVEVKTNLLGVMNVLLCAYILASYGFDV